MSAVPVVDCTSFFLLSQIATRQHMGELNGAVVRISSGLNGDGGFGSRENLKETKGAGNM